MSEIIKILVALSFAGAVLTFLLLLFRPLYKERMSKSWQYYIWLVIIVRMLLPWTLDIDIAPVKNVFQKMALENSKINTDIDTDVKNIVSDNVKESLKEISARAVTDAYEPHTETWTIWMIQFVQYMHIIWPAIALLLFTRKVTAYQSFAKYVYASSVPVNDIGMLEHFGNLIEKQHIRSTVGLYVNDVISSSMLIGFFHPRIVLTTATLSSKTSFHYTVLHELAHYKRMDIFYKWLVQIVVCLHWFNPFVYLIEREINRACELSCDEIVIKRLDAAAKRQYGDTLLEAIKAGGSYKNIPTSVTLNESKELLKGRLEAIMKYKEKSRFAKIFTVILTMLLCIGTAAVGVYKTPADVSSSLKKETSAGSIIYENGRYYVIDKGVSKSDKPSGGTVGGVGLVLVQKHGYVTLGPFSNVTKFADEVTNECKNRTGQKKWSAQYEYNMLIDAAKEIQSIGQYGQKRFPKLNKESIKLRKGETFSLKMTKTDKKSTWISSNEEVATVNQDGKVSAKKAGKAKIYAKIGRVMYKCKVKVTDKAVKKKYAVKDYAKYGITKKGSAYYYEDKRIRIFMDVKADNSFVRFNYDKKGTDDLRIRRAKDDSIVKVEYISTKEALSICNDMDITDTFRNGKKDAKPYVKVSRLLKNELPDSIAKAINSCSSKKWYVVSGKKCQYIYYSGLTRDYAFNPELSADSVKINISDIGASSGNYVLLAVRQNMPLTIYYNNVQVSYLRKK